jgi:hypothetical protein
MSSNYSCLVYYFWTFCSFYQRNFFFDTDFTKELSCFILSLNISSNKIVLLVMNMSLVLCILLLLLSSYTCVCTKYKLHVLFVFLNFDVAAILSSPYTTLIFSCSAPQSIVDYIGFYLINNFLFLFILLRNVTCHVNNKSRE